MKLSILHLSDVHFRASSASNLIHTRTKLIAAAVRAVDFGATNVLIVLSGDIAFSGKREEYEQAKVFLTDLTKELVEGRGFTDVKVVVVPGNHDCNFLGPRQYIRDALLKQQSTDRVSTTDRTAQAELLAAQDEFNNFATNYIGCAFNSAETKTTISYGKTVVEVVGYNTALSSQMHELQGDLYIPVGQLSQEHNNAAAVLAVFHHPYNWLESNNAREFKNHIESTADLVLTGHEHSASAYKKLQTLDANENTYFEGGVLQEQSTPNKSTFNLFVLELDAKTIQYFQYSFDGAKFSSSGRIGGIESFLRNRKRLRGAFIPKDTFEREFLNDAGAGFTTSKGKLTLSDIFVPPNLVEITSDAKTKRARPVISALRFLDAVADIPHVLIAGEEQCGKTTLAKQLFASLREREAVPLFARGKRYQSTQVAEAKIKDAFNSDLLEQYDGIDAESYWQLPAEKRVLILDDAHLAKIQKKSLRKFMVFAEKMFGKVIVFTHSLTLTDEITAQSQEEIPFQAYDRYAIADFGNVLREMLIQRWYAQSDRWDVDQQTFDRQVALSKQKIDDAIGKNMLPSFPIFILILLQQIEAATPLNTSAGAHGFLFESLITTALSRADTRVDLDTAYAFLGAMAEEMFSKKKQFLTESEFNALHKRFSEDTMQSLNQDKHERAFEQARILVKIDAKYWFRYKYCYYYFAARYLSEKLDTTLAKERLGVLVGEVYKEEYANILMFLAYLAKRDDAILNLMLKNAAKLYESSPECDFAAHTAFVDQLQKVLPNATLKNESSQISREQLNKQLDDQSGTMSAREREMDTDDEESRTEEFKEAMQLNAALKSIQIMGQLLKSFPASLSGAKKKEIANASYRLGLRTISSFLQLAEEHKQALMELFGKWLVHMKRPTTKAEWEESAEQFLVYLLDLFTTGVVSKVASSVGVPTLGPLYAEIREENPGLAFQIIDYALRLEHFEAFPLDSLDAIVKMSHSNIFPQLVMRRLTLNHFSRLPASIGDKQIACNRLKIDIQQLENLENRKNPATAQS